MNRSLIKKLWKLGDKQFIDYALSCARLTLRERETVQYLLFDGLTQEQAAEKMDISTRGLQGLWSCAVEKILLVPGAIPYIKKKKKTKGDLKIAQK